LGKVDSACALWTQRGPEWAQRGAHERKRRASELRRLTFEEFA
jgi:hypothetical protein